MEIPSLSTFFAYLSNIYLLHGYSAMKVECNQSKVNLVFRANTPTKKSQKGNL